MAEVYTIQTETIMSSPDREEANIGLLCYSKPSAGLIILREQVLEAERFDLAFRTMLSVGLTNIQPDDFFRTMENVW
jgi:hypothetical protein